MSGAGGRGTDDCGRSEADTFLLAFFARKLALVAEEEEEGRECEIRDARNPNPRDQESIHLIGDEGQTFRISLAKVYIIASLKPSQ